jgi:hypothetical protein
MNSFFILFLKFSGDDYPLLEQCSLAVRIRFALNGVIVFFFFAISFISLSFALKEIFHDEIFGYFLGFCFAIVLTNIYLLLIYTYNERVLPSINPSFLSFSFSYAIRILFLLFMLFIVSLPLEIYRNRDFLQSRISQYRIEKIKDYELKSKITYQKIITDLKSRMNRINRLDAANSAEQVAFYSGIIQKKEADAEKKLALMRERINYSHFFIRKIIYYFETGFSPIYFFLLILVFFTPIALKLINRIFHTDEFINKKRKVYQAIIEKEYGKFKRDYSLEMAQFLEMKDINKGITIEWTEKYKNPPYNTINIPKPIPESEEALKNWIRYG